MQKEILKKDHVSNKKKEPKWPNIKNLQSTLDPIKKSHLANKYAINHLKIEMQIIISIHPIMNIWKTHNTRVLYILKFNVFILSCKILVDKTNLLSHSYTILNCKQSIFNSSQIFTQCEFSFLIQSRFMSMFNFNFQMCLPAQI